MPFLFSILLDFHNFFSNGNMPLPVNAFPHQTCGGELTAQEITMNWGQCDFG